MTKGTRRSVRIALLPLLIVSIRSGADTPAPPVHTLDLTAVPEVRGVQT